MVDVSTKSQFHQYFRGSELVTAGRRKRSGSMSATVTAKGPSDRNVQYSIQSSDVSINHSWQDVNGNTPIERLWAFLALSQQLEDENYPATWTTTGPSSTSPSPRRPYKESTVSDSLRSTAAPSQTTTMALQYSFVTPSTCIELNTNVAPTAAPSTRRPGSTPMTSSPRSTLRPYSTTSQYSGTTAATASAVLLSWSCLLLLDRYAFNQVNEIASRVKVCLKPVAKLDAGFYRPADNCAYNAKLSARDGKAKETLANSVPKCLVGYKVDAVLVASAKQCLVKSLAADLKPALEMAEYTGDELYEISGRIQDCLSAIPDTAAISSDVADEAFYQAENGYPKESLLEYSIIPYLDNKNVNAPAVAAAEQCIAASLAKPLES
ncbi:uncharacterized protein LOC117649379 [Thrips palmi]|uniref:Uncharacterized protein LOC117649379 n=1 Tax=Thrips palmi TaxID=161013 RepID=A0A6P8ZSA1_THRPL|nr:uncharacterized protein LOC117649379 [Thrips palmi]